MSVLTCAFCGATSKSDQPGCSEWRIMEFQGRRFAFCPKEVPAPGSTAEEFAAAKLRCQEKALELIANEPPPKCQVCGCTELSACLEGCYWIAPGVLCSACVDRVVMPQSRDELLRCFEPLLQETVQMEIPGFVAFQLLSAVQLALRHPEFPDGVRETIEAFAQGLQHRVALTPQLAAIAAHGWDQKFDVPSVARLATRGIVLPGDPDFGV